MALEIERQETHPMSKVERTRARRVLTPAVDIYENNDRIVVTADMPGVDESSIDITLEQDVLTLEGRMPDEERPGFTLAFSELMNGDYRRVFTLATEVERDKISADVKDGVLTLILPKAEPAKARKITVKAR